MSEKEYVYLIYADTTLEDTSLMDFVGKVGKGSGRRYRNYVTPYGDRYKVCMIYLENAHDVEQKILKECRKRGYIKKRTETIYMPVSDSDTIGICKIRYNYLINDIISIFKPFGNLIDPDNIEILSEEVSTMTVSVTEPEIIDIPLVNYVVKFLETYYWDDWKSVSSIYNEYKKWCIECNVNPVAVNKFKTHAGNLITTRRLSVGMQYKRAR